MVIMLLEAPITQHCRQHHVNLYLAERDMIRNIAFRANWDWDQIQKRKLDIIDKSNKKENMSKSQIPYEYKV
jgi:hypothetical protein